MSWSTPPPDPTNPDVLDSLRQFLIGLGLVRDPRDSTNSNLPPFWLEPRYGVPGPGQTEGINPVEVGKTLVVAARDATDVPPRRYEGFLRHYRVELIYRSTAPQISKALENQIRANLNDKRAWTMVNVPVNESLITRGFQPISRGPLGFTYSQEYGFDLWGPFTQVAG